jgi:hypothetical protein
VRLAGLLKNDLRRVKAKIEQLRPMARDYRILWPYGLGPFDGMNMQETFGAIYAHERQHGLEVKL